MIQIKGDGTSLHTIKNPGQGVFLAVVALIFIVAISLGVGYLASKL